jgi:glucose-fructose oxidoreductase
MKKLNRRSFITIGTLSASSLWFPIQCSPAPKPTSAKKKDKIGVALLGLGSYSTYQLAPALEQTKHCYLAGIVTGSPHKIPDWQRRYDIPDSHVYSYETMDQIANNDDIDVVYIVTPTGTHARFAVSAANTGKHVWCEKPMAMNVDECQAIIDACNKNKVKLTIGYRVQHEPNTQMLNSYARTKPFGNFTRADAQAGYVGNGGSGWRFQKNMGGGALYDMGVYTVNGMRNALDMMPKRVVSARQFTNRPHLFKEVDETTEYVLEFEGGLKGYGKTSVGESMNHLRVTCENGWYEVRPMQTYNGVQGSRSDGVLLNTFLDSQQAKQMDDDALALLEGNEMMISGEEGLIDVKIIEAIIKSAEINQAVII